MYERKCVSPILYFTGGVGGWMNFIWISSCIKTNQFLEIWIWTWSWSSISNFFSFELGLDNYIFCERVSHFSLTVAGDKVPKLVAKKGRTMTMSGSLGQVLRVKLGENKTFLQIIPLQIVISYVNTHTCEGVHMKCNMEHFSGHCIKLSTTGGR